MAELKTIFSADTSGLNSAISKSEAGIGGLVNRLGKLAAGGMALNYARTLLDNADAMRAQADILGVSTNLLQAMKAMGLDANVPFEKIQTALNKIESARMDAISDSTGKAAQAFDKLGLNSQKLAGMNTEQTILAMASAYAKSGKSASELSGMIELLGNRNMALLPVFEQLGTEGEAAYARLTAAGKMMTDETVNNLANMELKLKEIGLTIGNVLSIGISKFIQGVEDIGAIAGQMSVDDRRNLGEMIDRNEAERKGETNRLKTTKGRNAAAVIASQQTLAAEARLKGDTSVKAAGSLRDQMEAKTDALVRIGGMRGIDAGGNNPALGIMQRQLVALETIAASVKSGAKVGLPTDFIEMKW
jgi:hypothetical protein